MTIWLYRKKSRYCLKRMDKMDFRNLMLDLYHEKIRSIHLDLQEIENGMKHISTIPLNKMLLIQEKSCKSVIVITDFNTKDIGIIEIRLYGCQINIPHPLKSENNNYIYESIMNLNYITSWKLYTKNNFNETNDFLIKSTGLKEYEKSLE
jgi:hypothetical protein